jgi:hypothetical protein
VVTNLLLFFYTCRSLFLPVVLDLYSQHRPREMT